MSRQGPSGCSRRAGSRNNLFVRAGLAPRCLSAFVLLPQGGRPSGEDAEQRLAAQNSVFFAEVMRWWRLHAGYGSLRDVEPVLLHALWLGAADSYCRHWVGSEQNDVPAELVSALANAAWDTLKGERSP